MRTFQKPLVLYSLCLAMLFWSACGDDSNPAMTLPGGCQSQGVYAIAALQANLTCLPTNGFTNLEEALGPPNAAKPGEGKLEFTGFLSLGVNGSTTFYMGSCIQDLPGPDVRVYQSVSMEAVEVQVSQNENGPFVSLGTQPCIDGNPNFTGFCEFDLAGSGLTDIRIVKVIDREITVFPNAACDNAGPSPGADIDAIEVIHPQ